MNKKELQIKFLKRCITAVLDLDKNTHRHIYNSALRGEVYEKETAYVLSKLVRSGDTVLDIGAHIGIISMYLGVMVGDQGRVYAFEPAPDNFSQLCGSIDANGFNNVECFNLALHSQTGQCTFYINSDNDGGHALWNVALHPVNRKSKTTLKTITVEVERLDNVMDRFQIPKPKLLKIDTEGLEFHILKGGLNRVLNQNVPYIISEMNIFGLQVMGISEMQFRGFMDDHGYNTYAILPGYRNPVPLPEEPVFKTGTDNTVLFVHRDALEGGCLI